MRVSHRNIRYTSCVIHIGNSCGLATARSKQIGHDGHHESIALLFREAARPPTVDSRQSTPALPLVARSMTYSGHKLASIVAYQSHVSPLLDCVHIGSSPPERLQGVGTDIQHQTKNAM